MAKADAIMKEIGDYVFQLPVEQRLVWTQDEIQAVCGHLIGSCSCCYYAVWMGRYFSGLEQNVII
jgi:hypothetical protein